MSSLGRALRRERGLVLWLLAACAVVVVFWLTRSHQAWMDLWVEQVSSPFKEHIAALCARVPFSVAECLVIAFALGMLVLLGWFVRRIVRGPERGQWVLRLGLCAASIAVTVYAGFCLLWGANYYATSFEEKSGITAQPVSVEELRATTAYFVEQVNRTAPLVPRDEEGLYNQPLEEIFAGAPSVYDNIQQQFPFLARDSAVVKPVFFSRLMSYTDFTGVYFPFTGESNVNVDYPPCLLPSTIAHEIAHQRNVAPEQEANFVAILACSTCDDPSYQYSGYLLGYIHLANALRGVDPEGWAELRAGLSPLAVADLAAYSAYWAQFDTPVRTATTTIYDSFLQSYGQELGMQSYGAVVDLLVAYYGQEASADATAQEATSNP